MKPTDARRPAVAASRETGSNRGEFGETKHLPVAKDPNLDARPFNERKKMHEGIRKYRERMGWE